MNWHKSSYTRLFDENINGRKKKIDAPNLATLFTKLYNSEGANLLLNL